MKKIARLSFVAMMLLTFLSGCGSENADLMLKEYIVKITTDQEVFEGLYINGVIEWIPAEFPTEEDAISRNYEVVLKVEARNEDGTVVVDDEVTVHFLFTKWNGSWSLEDCQAYTYKGIGFERVPKWFPTLEGPLKD